MKFLYLSLFLLIGTPVFSQVEDSTICHISFVKGIVKKPNDSIVITKDKIMVKDLEGLKFISEGSFVNLYHSALGSFQLKKNEMSGIKSHENLLTFIGHLMKIKGTKISLSTRGDCLCITAESCFVTDTSVNNKVLLIDSLTFAADQSVYEAESSSYFLQFKKNGELIKKNNKTVQNKLKIIDGNVSIYPGDIAISDSTIYNPDTDEILLCLFQVKDGQRETKLVAKLRVSIVSATDIQDYYTIIREGMMGKDVREIFEAFCQDLYIYFGKPNECQIKKLINYIN